MAAVRMITTPTPEAARIEHRVPGADVNPFFALAAVFALGVRGVEKKMALTVPPISHFTPEDKRAGKVRARLNEHGYSGCAALTSACR